MYSIFKFNTAEKCGAVSIGTHNADTKVGKKEHTVGKVGSPYCIFIVTSCCLKMSNRDPILFSYVHLKNILEYSIIYAFKLTLLISTS